MKRTTKEIKKRSFALVNAFPRFVSVVDRGANLIPLSKLQYSENAKFNDVDINRIEFSNTKFTDTKDVEAYLNSNGYEDFNIESTETGWFVPGVDTDLFEDITNVEYDDGVMYFIGKLKQEVADSAVAEIVDSAVLGTTDREVFEEANEEVVAQSEDAPVEEVESEQEVETDVVQEADEVTEEVVVAGDIVAGNVVTQEIADATVTTEVSSNREDLLSSAKFSSDDADLKHQLQEAQMANVLFTFDYIAYRFMDAAYTAVREGDMIQLKKNCNTFYTALDSLVNASKNLAFSEDTVDEPVAEDSIEAPTEQTFSMTRDELESLISEKLELFKQNTVKPVDNEVVLMQNSQRIKTDNLVVEVSDKETDTTVTKFNQDKIKDLFGIR